MNPYLRHIPDDRGDHWFNRAACKQLAPQFDAPTQPRGNRSPAEVERIARAVAVCARCTVAAECAADAIPGRDEGIRAGRVLPTLGAHKRPEQAGAA